MIDLEKAKSAFEKYISNYDQSIPSIRLKIVHTYKVMDCMSYLCQQLHLDKERTQLALLIALLHDLGRFEQWMRYESFADYKTIDHALFSCQLLFDQGKIRDFIEDKEYDDIIRHAILQHNKYKIDSGFDEENLLFIHLIRDSDKLDNFRVKDEEKIEDLLYASLDEVNHDVISKDVYDQFKNRKLIYGPTRSTKMDMWLSYIAFIFDLHFPQSLNYIKENHYVERSFDRLSPCNEIVKQQYDELRHIAICYIKGE